MHILGKILIWLIVLGAVGPLVLTSKVISYRNSWTKQIKLLQESNEKKQQEVAERQKKLTELRNELSRTMLGWGHYWDGFQAGVNNGMVGARGGIGADHGFGLPAGPEPPVVYLFMPDGEGGSRYVGAFQPPDAGSIRADEVLLKPTWLPRPGEEEIWAGAQDGWRCRTQIRAAYVRRFSDLYVDLEFADDHLARRQYNLQLQNKLHEVSKKLRDYRLQELLGPPDAKEVGSDHLLVGLVKAIEREEERRNATQARVDRLRREMEQATRKLQELIENNRELSRAGTRTETGTRNGHL